MASVITLNIEHASEIQELADRYYPAAYHLSVEDIAENFDGLQDEDYNFCFGLVMDGRLEGYIMAWLDNSLVEGRAEDVVLVDDICLSPRARRYLFYLLQSLAKAIEEAGLNGIPIEGTLRPEGESTFLGDRVSFEELGYCLVGKHKYKDEALGEELTWVRFEPCIEGAGAETADEDTSLDRVEVEFRSDDHIEGY